MLLLVCSQLHYWFIRDINSNCRYYTDDNYHSWYWRMICCLYTLLTMYHHCWLEMTLTDGEISPLCCIFTALWLCLMSRWAWASPHQNMGRDEELKPVGLQCISNNAASVSNPYWPKYIYTPVDNISRIMSDSFVLQAEMCVLFIVKTFYVCGRRPGPWSIVAWQLVVAWCSSPAWCLPQVTCCVTFVSAASVFSFCSRMCSCIWW